MNEAKIKQRLKKELSRGLDKGFFIFEKYINYSSDLYNEFVMLQSRYYRVVGDFNQNIITKDERDLTLDKLRVALLAQINEMKYEDIELSEIEKKISFNIPRERREGINAYRINDIGIKKIANRLERESHSVLFRIGYLGKSSLFSRIDRVIRKVIKREDMWDWHCAVFNHFGNTKYNDMLKEFYIIKNGNISIDKENNTTTQLFYVNREAIIEKFIELLVNHGVPVRDFVQILFVGNIKDFLYRDEFPKWDEFIDPEYNYFKNLDLDAAIIIDMDKIHIVQRDVTELFKLLSREILDNTNGKYLYVGKGTKDLDGIDITDYREIAGFGNEFLSNCND